MECVGRTIVRRRCTVATLILLITIGAVPGAARVSFEEDPQVFFRRDSRDLELLEQLAEDFGPDTNDVVIVIHGEDLFSARSVEAIRGIAFSAADLDGVDYALSIASLKRPGSLLVPLLPYSNLSAERLEIARQEAMKHPMAVGHLLSSDGTVTLILVRLSGTTMELSKAERVVNQLRAIGDRHSRGLDLEVHLSGAAMIAVESFANAKKEVLRIGLLSVIISAAIARLLFRSWLATAIAVLGPTVGVVWTVGAMGFTGQSISGVTTILPTLLFVIGFSDAIHLMLESGRWLRNGSSPEFAATRAIRNVGMACALTSLTTALGFGSLVLAETEGVRRFGMACSFGAILTLVSVVTVVPLLMSTRLASCMDISPSPSTARLAMRWSRKPLGFVLKHPRLISLIGVAATLLLLILTFQLRPEINMTEGIPLNSDTRRVVCECDAAFGGSLAASVTICWPDQLRLASPKVLEVAERVHEVLQDNPIVHNPMSILNVLRSISRTGTDLSARVPKLRRVPHELRDRLVRPDLRKLLVTVQVPDNGGAAMGAVFDRLDQKFQNLEQEYPGFQISLTGAPVVSARNVTHMILDLSRSLLFASVLIFLTMTIALRSFRLGAVSILPNVFPLVLATGMLVMTGQSLRLGGAVAFTLCLGLAVDDTIHLLVRFQQEQNAGTPTRRAVQRAYFQVGSAIVITSLVFVGGFAAMFVSVVPSILIFAQISCVAILAALIGDLLLLPSLLLWRSEKANRVTAAKSAWSSTSEPSQLNKPRSWSRSCFSWSWMYCLIIASSSPTVLTQ